MVDAGDDTCNQVWPTRHLHVYPPRRERVSTSRSNVPQPNQASTPKSAERPERHATDCACYWCTGGPSGVLLCLEPGCRQPAADLRNYCPRHQPELLVERPAR
jgi:hypothetical protein